MAKYIKKIFSTVICVILIGCSILKSHPKRKSYVSEIGNEIVRCIKDKDKEGLNYLFCDKIKDSEYLKGQVDYIFDYIDKKGGVVIEEGNWKYPASHGTYDGSGDKSIQYFSCKYSGNVHIDNKQYDLRFTAYQKIKRHNEYEGIITISIVEHMDSELIDKAYKYREDNSIIKRIFLGFDLFNVDYNTLQYMSILPKELNESEEYELLDSIENDR